jgi:tetratricopeptide (TPR) repeat protein
MPDIRLRDYTTKIKELIRNVRLDEAIAHCQHILHHYPKYIEPYGLLGEACLEKEMYREAIEFFQRTLSADPENLIARVGLGVIYDQQGALPEATWQLERAFELAPGNTEVRRELLRLYMQRDGSETARLRLTRGALGRLYSRNGLYERAVEEFHAVLRQDPDLPDIKVALAEALWREGRRLEAVETCVELLKALPNCLKANLILGEIWIQGGDEEEGRQRLDVAHALDPENRVAYELMGSGSPLPLEEAFLPELETLPARVELPAVEAWALTGAEVPAQEMLPVEAAEAREPEGELPDWLRDIGVEEQELVEELPGEELAVAESRPAEGISTDEMPEWLRAVMGEEAPVAAEEPAVVEEAAVEEVPVAAEEPAVVEGEAAVEEVPPVLEIPEWLRQLERAEAEEAAAPLVEAGVAAVTVTRGDETEEKVPTEEVPTEELEAPEAEEIPEWLQALVGAEIAAETKEAMPFAAEGVVELPEAEAPAVEEWVPAVEEEAPFLEEETVVVEEEIGPVEEMPAWLRELETPVGELAPSPVVEIVEEAPAEPEYGPGGVPASLLALVEAGLLDEADLQAAMSEMSAEELEEQRTETVPAWLQELIGEEMAPAAEVPAEEQELPVEEVALPAVEAVVIEAAPPVEEVPPPAVEAVVIEAAPPVEEVLPPAVEVVEEAAPPVEEVPPPAVEAEVEEEIVAPSRIDLLVEALKSQPRNQEARLELARLYSDEQNWNAALAQYEKLISARRLLPDVLGDLELLAEEEVDRARVYQLLGDVHMHQDQLDKALEMYRLARQWLTKH